MMEARIKELNWLQEFGSLDFDNDSSEADEDVYDDDDDDFPDDSSMPDLETEVGENVHAPRRRRVKPPRRRRYHRGETPEFVRRMMPRAYRS
ncbi:hypothetical protein PENSPDRAFT_647532 [Peniophora sp. CONT]|nr:hypothetical protein PENSPDRAFT_647532 [Peniophora sp. CONT]